MQKTEFLAKLAELLPEDASRFRVTIAFNAKELGDLSPGIKQNGLVVSSATHEPTSIGSTSSYFTAEVVG